MSAAFKNGDSELSILKISDWRQCNALCSYNGNIFDTR